MNKDMINQLDENNLPHGPWVYYSTSGRVHTRVMYKHGISNGYYKSYFTNGTKYLGFYKNSEEIGLWYEHKYEY
jgi:antitoxin component YwqK of YwqJK toxin-antitoxin module